MQALTKLCPNLAMFWPSILIFFGVLSLPTHGLSLFFFEQHLNALQLLYDEIRMNCEVTVVLME